MKLPNYQIDEVHPYKIKVKSIHLSKNAEIEWKPREIGWINHFLAKIHSFVFTLCTLEDITSPKRNFIEFSICITFYSFHKQCEMQAVLRKQQLSAFLPPPNYHQFFQFNANLILCTYDFEITNKFRWVEKFFSMCFLLIVANSLR